MKNASHKLVDYLAFAISAISSPYIVAAIFSAIIFYTFARNLTEFLPWMLTFSFFAILIPGSFFVWQLETHQISDLHVANQNERKIPFLIGGISASIGTILLQFLGASHQVIVIGAVYSLNALILSIITQFWKISIHTSMYVAVVTMAMILFDFRYWWLIFFTIPIAWSRIHRHKHSVWQTLAGSIVAFLLTAFAFWIFGYDFK